jgi:enamine deaminase RidA (YjgF/YER057c/UK114 family)
VTGPDATPPTTRLSDSAPVWTADRQRVASGAAWEARVGYARAVRVGPFVYVAGTTGIGPDGRPVPGGMYAQTRRAFEIAGEALAQAGASFADVVRTRMYVTDVAQWEEAGRAHAERFADVRPAATLVAVAALVDPALVVEVELDAVVGSGHGMGAVAPADHP